MTISEFCSKYLGKKIDFDGVYGAQCVDLFRKYCEVVLNIEHTGSVDGAKDLWEMYNFLPKEQEYFIRSPYPVSIGDVVIFKPTPNNKYGHVALYLATDSNSLLVFEQNGYTQDGCKYSWRSEDDVLGVLRRR